MNICSKSKSYTPLIYTNTLIQLLYELETIISALQRREMLNIIIKDETEWLTKLLYSSYITSF